MINSYIEINSSHKGGIQVIEVSGRLDSVTVGQFKKNFYKTLDAKNREAVLDMSGISFVDSSGLGVLVVIFKEMKAQGGDMLLCGLHRNVRQIFELVKFDRIFKIFNSQEEAVASCLNYSGVES